MELKNGKRLLYTASYVTTELSEREQQATDASLSTENEARHSNAINFGATLSGGYGLSH